MGFYFDFPTELAIVIAALSTLLVAYVKHKYTFWPRRNVPQLQPELFFGNARKMILKQVAFGDTFSHIYNHFKSLGAPVGGFYIALKPELMLVDIDIIKSVMIKDFQHFTDRGNFVDEKNDPLTGHLFALPGLKWKSLRTKLTPTFTSGKMKMMFQTVVDTSKELQVIMDEKSNLGAPLDIKDILARFTTDVIGSCAFGIDCNCLRTPDTDFRKYGALSFSPQGVDMLRQLLAITAPWVMSTLKIRGINKDISEFFLNLVKETVDYREKNNVFRKDFMHLLIQLKNRGKVTEDESIGVNGDGGGFRSNGSLSIEEMAAQSFVFFLAGFETSSTTMTFCLFELAANQEIQDRLRREVNDMLRRYDGEMTYEGVMEMPYMDKVVNGKCSFLGGVCFLQVVTCRTWSKLSGGKELFLSHFSHSNLLLSHPVILSPSSR